MREHLTHKQRIRLEALNQAVALHAGVGTTHSLEGVAGAATRNGAASSLPGGAVLDTAKTFETYLKKGWA